MYTHTHTYIYIHALGRRFVNGVFHDGTRWPSTLTLARVCRFINEYIYIYMCVYRRNCGVVRGGEAKRRNTFKLNPFRGRTNPVAHAERRWGCGVVRTPETTVLRTRGTWTALEFGLGRVSVGAPVSRVIFVTQFDRNTCACVVRPASAHGLGTSLRRTQFRLVRP